MPRGKDSQGSHCRMSAAFRWHDKKTQVALELSQGKTQKEITRLTGVPDRTIRSWMAAIEFQAEVDRLSSMIDIASRAERLRMAMRAVRKMRRKDGSLETRRDLLDWLKFAQSETQGLKLDLTAISEAHHKLMKKSG